MDNFKIKLELKSKFFKDLLLDELQKNNVEILSKKIVPHFKNRFIINIIVRITEAKKLKDIIKNIELIEKTNEADLLEQKRKEFNN